MNREKTSRNERALRLRAGTRSRCRRRRARTRRCRRRDGVGIRGFLRLLRGRRRIHDRRVVLGFLLSRRTRRSDNVGFLFARSEKRRAGQNAE